MPISTHSYLKSVAEKIMSLREGDLLLSSYELHRQASRIWSIEEEVDSFSYKYQKQLIPYRNDNNVYNNTRPDFIFRRPFVAELRNGAIVGPRAAVLSSDGQIAADSLKRPAKHHEITAHIAGTVFSRSYFQYRQNQFQTAKEPDLETAAVLHRKSTSGNFYHWLIERLLTLRGIRQYEQETGQKVDLVLSAHAPDWVYNLLEHTGFGDNQIIIWNGGPLHVERVVLPSWPELTPQTLQWLRDEVLASVGRSDAGPEYIYISRQKSDQRVVENYDEIQPLLERYGVQPVHLENMSFEEEVQLVNGADGIIGPHGAGLTAMIWGERLSVFELFNGITIAPFYVMADVLGFEYTAMLGETRDNRKENLRHKNTYIDPQEFETKLREFTC